MNDRIRRLPDSEQEVMQAIWACKSPVARTDIEKILFKNHPMALQKRSALSQTALYYFSGGVYGSETTWSVLPAILISFTEGRRVRYLLYTFLLRFS